MGSFNVACSISNLSIGPGDRTYFIPLVDANSYRGRRGVETMLVGNGVDVLMQPYCLPICGHYDDYGRIENIEASPVTKRIEELFGMTIDEFIHCVTDGAQPWDAYNPVTKLFGIDKTIHHGYERVNPEIMRRLGFTQDFTTKKWTHPSTDRLYVVLDFFEWGQGYLTPGFYVYDEDGKEVGREQDADAGKLQRVWHDAVLEMPAKKDVEYFQMDKRDCFLNIPFEHQWKIKDLMELGGMFVLAEIYDALAAIEVTTYKNLTITQYHDKMVVDHKAAIDEIANLEAQGVDKDFILYRKMSLKDYPNYDFIRWFHHWRKFNKNHQDAILTGKLKKETIALINVMSQMYSMNRFFFPAMNGEQCGNDEASKLLLELSTRIVDARIKEREEW